MQYSVCLLVAIFAASAVAQKPRKAPDVEMLDGKARRGEETIALYRKVRVTAEKPLRGLVLAFDFLSASGDVLIPAKTRTSPGAIQFRIQAFDTAEHELRIANGGPSTIE